MKSLATILAVGSLVLAAPAAMAQQPGAQRPGQQGGQQAGQQQQTVERLGTQDAQQLAGQPELQDALKKIPDAARNALNKAAQAQGGQLVGLERDTRNGTTNYEGQIARGGRLYEMKVDSDGNVLKWEPKTR